jgi:hypothetical protein
MNILQFSEFLNEDTSATGGPAVSGSAVAAPTSGGVALGNTSIAGMGPVQSSQPSAFPGALNGADWINGGGESGSGDIGVPYNPSGANRMFQKIPSPMGKNHGSKTGKKSREKKLDLKHLRDVLKNRPKAGSGKIMNFDNFAKKDITTKVTKIKESVSDISGIPSDKVWVVVSMSDTDIYEIYLNKSDAEKVAIDKNVEWRNHIRNIHKKMSDDEFEEYFKFHKLTEKKCMSLHDAIDLIKDQIHGDFAIGDAGEDI